VGTVVVGMAFLGEPCIGRAGKNKDGYYGYSDKGGTVVIEPQFSWAGQLSGGLANVMVGDKLGYIKQARQVRMEPDTVSVAAEQ
jgi:hypothetical protein